MEGSSSQRRRGKRSNGRRTEVHMPISIAICTQSRRVRIPNRRHTIPCLCTRGLLGAEVVPVHTSHLRPRMVGCAHALLLLLCRVHVCKCECKAQGAKCKV